MKSLITIFMFVVCMLICLGITNAADTPCLTTNKLWENVESDPPIVYLGNLTTDPYGGTSIDEKTYIQLFKDAIESWKTDNSYFVFDYTGATCTQGEYDGRVDRMICVSFGYIDDCELAGSKAGKIDSYYSSGNKLKGADIVINQSCWSPDNSGILLSKNREVFQSIAAHELGHAWGVDDTHPDGDTIMNSDRDLDKVYEPTECDLVSLADAYPSSDTTVTIDPDPDIKANNSDGAITIETGDTLTIAISLDPGSYSGTSADWYIVVYTSSGWQSYDMFEMDYSISGFSALVEDYGLVSLDSTEIYSTSSLDAGTYTYYFAVDLSGEYYDNSVTVTVEEGEVSAPTGFTTSVSGDSITFSWNSVSEADGYKLYYGYSSGNYAGWDDLSDMGSHLD